MIKDGIKYFTVFFTASEKARPATPQEHRSSIADFLDRVQENVVFIHFNLQGAERRKFYSAGIFSCYKAK